MRQTGGQAMKNLLFGIFLICIVNCCQSGDTTFTDPRDGQVYKTVKIGNQVWMAENLNYIIPSTSDFDYCTDSKDYVNRYEYSSSGSCCYDFDPDNGKKFGRLYKWDASMRAVPAGWHIPSKQEFELLLKIMEDENKDVFEEIELGGSSECDSLFGGYVDPLNQFSDRNVCGYYWSSSIMDDDRAWYLIADYNSRKVSLKAESRSYGYSIRLIKD
jgi:uncharacterized protein (TIGR02145 family)